MKHGGVQKSQQKMQESVGKGGGLVNFPWASLLGCKSKIRPQGLWLCALPHRPADGDPSKKHNYGEGTQKHNLVIVVPLVGV